MKLHEEHTCSNCLTRLRAGDEVRALRAQDERKIYYSCYDSDECERRASQQSAAEKFAGLEARTWFPEAEMTP